MEHTDKSVLRVERMIIKRI